MNYLYIPLGEMVAQQEHRMERGRTRMATSNRLKTIEYRGSEVALMLMVPDDFLSAYRNGRKA